MKAEMILHTLDTIGYECMIGSKEWITSSETKNFIKKELPNLKKIVTFGRKGYGNLYRLTNEGWNGIQGATVNDLGGRTVRFYNKPSLVLADFRCQYWGRKNKIEAATRKIAATKKEIEDLERELTTVLSESLFTEQDAYSEEDLV